METVRTRITQSRWWPINTASDLHRLVRADYRSTSFPQGSSGLFAQPLAAPLLSELSWPSGSCGKTNTSKTIVAEVRGLRRSQFRSRFARFYFVCLPWRQDERFGARLPFWARTGFSNSPEETREAHFSAQYPSPCQEAWLSRPYGYRRRPKRPEGTSPEGPCPSVSLTFADSGLFAVRPWPDRFASKRFLGAPTSKRCHVPPNGLHVASSR